MFVCFISLFIFVNINCLSVVPELKYFKQMIEDNFHCIQQSNVSVRLNNHSDFHF